MSYTVVGIFPNKKEAANVLSKLQESGFHDSVISHAEVKALAGIENESKQSFWSWLFDNDLESERYEYASLDSNTVTVYVETREDALKVQEILNDNGAIDVEEKSRRYIRDKYPKSNDYPISEEKKARIIAKAKNDLYFTDERTSYKPDDGMSDEMDSLGNKAD